MKQFAGETFFKFRDQNCGQVFSDLFFSKCTFDNCALSRAKTVAARSTIRNVRISDCRSVNSTIGPAIFDDVVVDGLCINDLLILWCPVFRHVCLKGHLGSIKFNSAADSVIRSQAFQQPFDQARDLFYSEVDWALDISEAEFTEFSMRGVPARLIRRDPRTQVVITREKALRNDWREQVSPQNDWIFSIDLFLRSGEADTVLAAPKGRKKKKYVELLDGLKKLRDCGVTEDEGPS